MSTPPGQYDTLDQLAAASEAAPPAATFDNLPAAPAAPAADFSFVAEGRPSVSMPGFLITVDDSLVFSAWNSNPTLQAVTMQLRVMKPDGTLVIQAYTISHLTADRTQNSVTAQQLSGYLVGVDVGPPGVALARGQCYVNVVVMRGTATNPLLMQTLLADYVTSAFQPAFPYGSPRSALDGRGYIYTFVSANPGAGADLQFQQPLNTVWKISAIQYSLATDSTVGSRTTALHIFDSLQQAFLQQQPGTQPPGTTYAYQYGAGITQSDLVVTNPSSPLPDEFSVAAPLTYATETTNKGGSDQYSAMSIVVEEWINV